MRVLFINNSSPRCGERVFGEIWAHELWRLGVDIVEWDGSWSTVYHRGAGHEYMPADVCSYDLIHVNWGPANLGHYQPQHFPASVPLSVFLHDVPPNSTCLLAPRAQLLMAYEPMAGAVVLEHAVPSYRRYATVRDAQRIVIGVTGIRDDAGAKMLEEICKSRDWEFNCPFWWKGGRWLSVEEEIDRLTMSTVNVCWYQTSGRGKSMAAMFCCAARRPLLLSGSTMFSSLWPYRDEISIALEGQPLEGSIDALLEAGAPVPNRVCRELSWERRAKEIKALWEGVARK